MATLPKYKSCSNCKIQKPLSEYYCRKDRPNQVRPKCKLCESLMAKKYYENNPEKMAEYRQRVKDRKNKWTKEYQKTKKYKESKAKTREKYKEKRREYNRQWRENNKEKVAQHWRNRRARLLNAQSDNYTVNDLLQAYGADCYLCHQAIDLTAPRKPKHVGDESFHFGLHIDHLVPLSRGGNDLLENVRPAHAICNLKKGKK